MDYIGKSDKTLEQEETIASFYNQSTSKSYKGENDSLDSSGVVISETYIKESKDNSD